MQSPNKEIVRFLGEGSFGQVNLVRYSYPHDGSCYLYAVKNSYEEDYDSLQRELQILQELRGYPNIVTCFGDSLEESVSAFGEKLYKLQLEYASEGSLRALMGKHADRKLPEPLIKDFTRMILHGLVCVHGHSYIHCDIKPDNLLVFPCSTSSYDYEIKIADFGNALEVGDVPKFWESGVPWLGTAIYMSPESVRDGVPDMSLDLWSVGCLVLEMYTDVRPWEGVHLTILATLLRCGKAPDIPECLPSDAKDFIHTCFSREPEERGSATELLSHPFLSLPQVQVEVEEDKKTEDEMTSNSFLLKLLKLRIRRRSSKKKPTTNSLKLGKTKATQFKRTPNKVLTLKFMPFKKLTYFTLVSVH